MVPENKNDPLDVGTEEERSDSLGTFDDDDGNISAGGLYIRMGLYPVRELPDGTVPILPSAIQNLSLLFNKEGGKYKLAQAESIIETFDTIPLYVSANNTLFKLEDTLKVEESIFFAHYRKLEQDQT